MLRTRPASCRSARIPSATRSRFRSFVPIRRTAIAPARSQSARSRPSSRAELRQHRALVLAFADVELLCACGRKSAVACRLPVSLPQPVRLSDREIEDFAEAPVMRARRQHGDGSRQRLFARACALQHGVTRRAHQLGGAAFVQHGEARRHARLRAESATAPSGRTNGWSGSSARPASRAPARTAGARGAAHRHRARLRRSASASRSACRSGSSAHSPSRANRREAISAAAAFV